MPPSISIVIPTHNHVEDALKPCIDSILQYTDLQDVEIIVVANGCGQDTKDYLQTVPVDIIWDDTALGYTKATNLGIQHASGNYIVLLNNDAVLLPQEKNTWINMLKAPFLENGGDNKVGLTGPLILFDNYAGSDVLIFFCAMIKKEVFDKIGILGEEYSPGGGEDIDFCMRAKEHEYTMAIVPDNQIVQTTTNVGHFPIHHFGECTLNAIDYPEYGASVIKKNGLRNLLKYNRHIRLNLGSGGVEVPGFISVDMNDTRASVIMDVTKLDVEFSENSVDELLGSHIFEHLSPYQSMDVLRSWYKILVPGGRLVLEMPDIAALCDEFTRSNDGDRYGLLNCIYGAVNTTDAGNPSDITSPHLWGWTREHLEAHLQNAGFQNIQFTGEQFPHPGFNFRVECSKPL